MLRAAGHVRMVTYSCAPETVEKEPLALPCAHDPSRAVVSRCDQNVSYYLRQNAQVRQRLASAQHLVFDAPLVRECSLCERSERADNRLDNRWRYHMPS